MQFFSIQTSANNTKSCDFSPRSITEEQINKITAVFLTSEMLKKQGLTEIIVVMWKVQNCILFSWRLFGKANALYYCKSLACDQWNISERLIKELCGPACVLIDLRMKWKRYFLALWNNTCRYLTYSWLDWSRLVANKVQFIQILPFQLLTFSPNYGIFMELSHHFNLRDKQEISSGKHKSNQYSKISF